MLMNRVLMNRLLSTETVELSENELCQAHEKHSPAFIQANGKMFHADVLLKVIIIKSPQ